MKIIQMIKILYKPNQKKNLIILDLMNNFKMRLIKMQNNKFLSNNLHSTPIYLITSLMNNLLMKMIRTPSLKNLIIAITVIIIISLKV